MEAINIYPELIKWKPNKQGLVAVAIRFDYNRQRVVHERLGYSIKVNDWDADQKRVKSSYSHHVLLNQLLENRINIHRNYFLRRQTFKLPVNRELIRKYITSGTALECFYEYAEQVIQTKKLSDGQPYSEDSKRRYRDEIKRLIQFSKNLSFNELTIKFLEKYKLWLQNEYKKKDNGRLDENSIWKALSFVRMIYNQAIKDEIILADDNPFKKFIVGSYAEHFEKIKYLNKKEMDALENVLINHSDSLPELTRRIGWRFLAMCVTGCRISDAMNLDDAFFNDAGDLQFKPHKTRRHGNIASIPIQSDKQREFLQKTISFAPPKTHPKSFRTTFNIHLKMLALKAGIEINLTSHVGRHTMGSFLVDANVDKKAAMAMLGVKSEKVIETYLHLKENKLRDEAKKLKNVF